MSYEVIPFAPNMGAVTIPDNIKGMFEDTSRGDSIPKISIKGKVWSSVANGETNQYLDAEDNPIPTLKVVVLGETPGRCRTYFAGKYSGDSNIAPTCHSYDGVAPATDAKEPQSGSCRSCPMSVKGSKLTDDGKATTACSTGKRLAVVPSNNIEAEPYLLQLPITSVWTESDPYADKGYFCWDSYKKSIKKYGVINPAMVETWMKFDPKSEYPKVIFKAGGQFPTAALMRIAERCKEDEIAHIIGMDRCRPESAETPAPAAKSAGVGNVAPAKVKPQTTDDDLLDDEPVAKPQVAKQPVDDLVDDAPAQEAAPAKRTRKSKETVAPAEPAKNINPAAVQQSIAPKAQVVSDLEGFDWDD